MDKRKYLIVNEFTGETMETYDNKVFNEIVEDISNNFKKVFYSPLDNEITIFYQPLKVVIESYSSEENKTVREKAIITPYNKSIYNPYSME